MEVFWAKVREYISNYGEDVSNLAIGYAIEAFKDIRHYPRSYSEDMIVADLNDNIGKVAMAAIEIESKNGVEGQISQTENGMSRSYTENILAYRDVVGFAHTL